MPPINGEEELEKLEPLIQSEFEAENKARYNEYKGSDITSDIIEGSKLADYAKGRNSAIWDSKSLQNDRAGKQGVLGAIGNGVAQTIAAMPGRVLAAAGDMLDLPDYVRGTALGDLMGVDGEDGYGNFFSDWLRESAAVKGVEDAFEVRQFADAGLRNNMGSYEWWRAATGALTDLAGSASEFAVAGAGIGSLISKGLRTAGMVSALSKTTLAGQKGFNVAERLLTATALNQAESIGTAADLHKRIYDQAIFDGLTGDKAAEKASIAASTAMNLNRINIALNLTSVGAFGMGGFGTRQMLKSAKMSTVKDYALEGAQEFAEEVINFTAEKGGERAAEEGVNQGFLNNMLNITDRARSIEENPGEALEAGILGMIGGVAQTAATSSLVSDRALSALDGITGVLPAKLKAVLTSPMTQEVIKFEDGLPVEKPKGESGEFAGFETERVSKAEAHKRQYDRQQKLKKEYYDTFGKATADKMFDLHTSVAEQKQIMDEMVIAKESGQDKTYDKLRRTLLTEQAYQAFESGTTGHLIAALEGEANRTISENESLERGLPADYKANMQEGAAIVKELEKEYLTSKGYENSYAIYSAKAAELATRQYKNKAKNELNINKQDFNSAVEDAIADGKIKVGNFVTRTKGEKIGDEIIPEQSIEDFLGGDFSTLIDKSHPDFNDSQAEQVKGLLSQLGRLFPDEIVRVINSHKEVISNTEHEYRFKNLHNTAKSNKVQVKAKAEAREKAAAEKQEKADEVKAKKQAKAKNKEAAKINKAKQQSKDQESIDDAREALDDATITEDLDDGLFEDKATEKRESTPRGSSNRGRSKSKVEAHKELKLKPKPKTKTDSIKDEHSAQEDATIDKLYDNLRDALLATDDSNQDPGLTEGDTKALAVFEAQRSLIAALQATDEAKDVPSWYDMVDNYVDKWGIDFTKKYYGKLAGAYGLLTNEQIKESFEEAYEMTAEELNQFNLAQDAEEEVISGSVYTNDTHHKVMDYNETVESEDNYGANERNERKTDTGHNIMGYLAIGEEYDTAELEEMEEAIRDNMPDPTLLHPDHYNVGDKLTLQKHPDPMSQMITYKNKRVTFAEYDAAITDLYGRGTLDYVMAYNAEFPIQIVGENGVIGYVHAESWINDKNVSSSATMSIAVQKRELAVLRSELMTNGVMDIKISDVTPGKPVFLRNDEGETEYMSTKDALPGNDVGILVRTNEGLQGQEGQAVSLEDLPPHIENLPLGATVAMLPTKVKGRYFSAALSMNNISEDTTSSINTAIEILTSTDGSMDSLAEELKAASGIDVRTMSGFQKYVSQFIYTINESMFKHKGGRTNKDKFSNWVDSTGESNVFVYFDGTTMHIKRGSGLPLSDVDENAPLLISIDKTTKQAGRFAPFLREMFSKFVYTKVDAEKTNSDSGVWSITENGVENLAEDGYNEYVKASSRSNVGGLNIGTEEHPNYVYTIQPIIEFKKDDGASDISKEIPNNTEEAIEKGKITESEIEVIVEAAIVTNPDNTTPTEEDILTLEERLKDSNKAAAEKTKELSKLAHDLAPFEAEVGAQLETIAKLEQGVPVDGEQSIAKEIAQVEAEIALEEEKYDEANALPDDKVKAAKELEALAFEKEKLLTAAAKLDDKFDNASQELLRARRLEDSALEHYNDIEKIISDAFGDSYGKAGATNKLKRAAIRAADILKEGDLGWAESKLPKQREIYNAKVKVSAKRESELRALEDSVNSIASKLEENAAKILEAEGRLSSTEENQGDIKSKNAESAKVVKKLVAKLKVLTAKLEVAKKGGIDTTTSSRPYTSHEITKATEKLQQEIAEYKEWAQFGDTFEDALDGALEWMDPTKVVARLRKEGLSDTEIDLHPDFLEKKRRAKVYNKVIAVFNNAGGAPMGTKIVDAISEVEEEIIKLPSRRKRSKTTTSQTSDKLSSAKQKLKAAQASIADIERKRLAVMSAQFTNVELSEKISREIESAKETLKSEEAKSVVAPIVPTHQPETQGIPTPHYDAAWKMLTSRYKSNGISSITKSWFVSKAKDQSPNGKKYAAKVYDALVIGGVIITDKRNRAVNFVAKSEEKVAVKSDTTSVKSTSIPIHLQPNERGLTSFEEDQYSDAQAMLKMIRFNFKNGKDTAKSRAALLENEELIAKLEEKMAKHMGVEEDTDTDVSPKISVIPDLGSMIDGALGFDDSKVNQDPRALEDSELYIITEPLSEVLIDTLTAGRQEQVIDTAVGLIVSEINNGNKKYSTTQALNAILTHVNTRVVQLKSALDIALAQPDVTEMTTWNGVPTSIANVITELQSGIPTLESLAKNREVLYRLITTRMSTINGTKVDQSGISEDDGTADRNKDQYDENASFTADSKKTVGANVRRFLSGITDATIEADGRIVARQTWFGTASFVNFNDIFNTVSKLLAGVEPEYELMLAVLKENQSNFPWMQQLVKKLEVARVKDDTGVVNEFVTGMSKHEINMTYIWWSYDSKTKKYEAQVLNANSRALGTAIQSQWMDNLMRSPKAVYDNNGKYYIDPEFANELIKEYNDILEYTGEDTIEHSVKMGDLRPQLKQYNIGKVGDSAVLKDLPTAHPLNTITSFPAYIGAKAAQMKITKNVNGDLVLEYASPIHTPVFAMKKVMLQSWASKLGIDLADNTLNQLQEDGIVLSTKKGAKAKVKLNSLLSKKGAKSPNNPFWYINEHLKKVVSGDLSVKAIDDDGGFSTHKSIKNLAMLQAKYEKQIFSTTFKAGGKNISTYTANKYITDRLRSLKTNKNAVTGLANLSFSRHSLWMQDFVNTEDNNIVSKDNADNPMTASYVSLQALQKRGATSGDEKSLMDIAPGEHEFYKLALFANMKGGAYNGKRMVSFLYPTVPADKSSRFIINYTAYKTELSKDGVADSVIETFYDSIFQSEFQRIKKFQGQNIKTNVKEYDTGANLFHFLPILNSIPALWNEDGTLKNISAFPDLVKLVKNSIKTTIDDTVSAKIRYWKDFGLVDSKTNKDGTPAKSKLKYVDSEYIKHINGKIGDTGLDEVTAAAYDFEVNQMLATANMFQMFIGDPAVFHKERAATDLAKNELRRHYAIQEWAEVNKTEIDDYPEYYRNGKDSTDSFIQTYDALPSHMKNALNTLANARLKLIKNKQQVLIKLAEIDPARAHQLSNEMVREVFNNVGKRLAADVAPGHDIPGSKNRHIKYLFLKDKETKSLNFEFYKSLELRQLADYLKVEGTDAQEYTTWQHHLGLLKDLGRISSRKHDMLKKKIEAGDRLNDDLLSEVLQPVKPVYANNVVDSANDFDRRVFIKSSSFPLLPQLTNGLEIDKLRSIMEGDYKTTGKTSYDRAPYHTAVKVGMPTTMLNMYDPDGDIREDIEGSELVSGSLELPMTGFRIQMDVPYKESKHKSGVGSQERKVLFTNIRKSKGFTHNGKSHTGASLEKEYNKLYGKLFKSGYSKLRKELTENGELSKSRLQKLLKKEAQERGYPIADILGLEFDPVTNDFILPVWANPSHKQFESLMISIVKNRILKMKFEGGSFVMGSEEGFRTLRKKEDTEEEYETRVKEFIEEKSSGIAFTKDWQGQLYPGGKYWVNHDGSRRYSKDQYATLSAEKQATLQEKIMPSQVLIPSKIRGKDGHLMDMKNFVDEKTGMIDHKRLPKELLEFFHFRIPTQGPNSMSWAKVVGFLPPEVGDLMIGSRDLTRQKGLDYDVDKEYAYFFNMNAEVKNQDDIDVAMAELAALYEEDGEFKKQQAIIEDLNAKLVGKEYMTYSYKSDEARAAVLDHISKLEADGMVSEGAVDQVMEHFDSMSDVKLKALNERTYRDTKVGSGHLPIYTKWSGELADTMSVLKAALEAANEARNNHNHLFKAKADAKRKINGIRTTKIKVAKDKLRQVKYRGTHMSKVSPSDTKSSVFIELDKIDPDTEQPIKVEIVTNNVGAILNKEDLLKEAWVWEELEAHFDGNVEEEFAIHHADSIADKLIMNEILEIHKEVLLHEDMQKYMYEPLAFGDLKGDAGYNVAQKIFDFKNKVNKKSSAFSPLSSDFQRDKLTSGLAGRVGIGVLSLDSVFLSQAQDKGLVLTERVNTGEQDEEGKDIYASEAIHVEFGDTYTETAGDISGINVNQNRKKKRFDTVAAFQSAAVDNENEQILDKINANKTTFPVIRALAALGFDEKLIAAFLSQAGIVELVETLVGNESDLVYDDRTEKEIISSYETENKVKHPKFNHRGYPPLVDNIGFQDLMDMIEKEDKYGPTYFALQGALMRKFVWLKEVGEGDIKTLQDVLKVDSGAIGENFMHISNNFKKFIKLLMKDNVENAKTMIGDVVPVTGDSMDETFKLNDDYVLIEGYGKAWWVKPETVPGHAIVYGLKTANELFDGLIPYDDLYEQFSKLAKDILGTDEVTPKQMVKVFDEIKSFMFTHDASKVIISESFEYKYEVKDGDTSETKRAQFTSIQGYRKRLLVDVKVKGEYAHKSLATIISELKNNNVINNPFLNRLSTKELQKAKVSMIEYNASAQRGYDETAVYNGFADLFKNRVDLGEFNGKTYDTVKLAQDLIAYSYMNGGIQSATNFIKYIPVSYLHKLGYGTGMRGLMKEMTTHTGKASPLMYKFFEQYVRNNPSAAPNVTLGKSTDKEEVLYPAKGPKGQKIYKFNKGSKSGAQGSMVSVKEPNAPNGHRLFKWNDNENAQYYHEVNTLSFNNVKEYDAMAAPHGLSTILARFGSYKPFHLKGATSTSMDTYEWQGRYNDYPVNIAERLERHEAYLGHIAATTEDEYHMLMANFIGEQTEYLEGADVIVNNTTGSRGSHEQRGEDSILTFNESRLGAGTKFNRERTIIHEYTHGLTDKYLDMRDISGLSKAKQNAIINLKKMHSEFKDSIGTDAYNKMMHKYLNGGMSNSIKDFEYAAYSVNEFVAVALTSKAMQEHLKSIKSGRTNWWSKLVQHLTNFLKVLGFKDAEGTLLAELVEDFMTITDYDMALSEELYSSLEQEDGVRDIATTVTEQQEAKLRDLADDIIREAEEEAESGIEKEEAPSGRKKVAFDRNQGGRGGRSDRSSSRGDTGESNINDDPMVNDNYAENANELVGGINKTLRINNLQDIAKELADAGRIEFKCK